ncbi:MAG: hypothetical protein AB7P03_16790 [Kofleriaceae bacterium]
MTASDTLFSQRCGDPPGSALAIAGFGIEATLRPPVGIAQLADGLLILGPLNLAEARDRGSKNALLQPGVAPTCSLERRATAEGGLVTYSSGQRGTSQLVLGNGMQTYDELLQQLRAADHPAGWRIVADDHEIRWPTGFTLRVDTRPMQGRRYELVLGISADKRMFIEGPIAPSDVPRPEQLMTEGHELIGAGSLCGVMQAIRWIELAERTRQAQWVQRCYYVPVDVNACYLLHARAPMDSAIPMFAAADLVAMSFRPRLAQGTIPPPFASGTINR